MKPIIKDQDEDTQVKLRALLEGFNVDHALLKNKLTKPFQSHSLETDKTLTPLPLGVI